MKREQAERLLQVNMDTLSLEQIQRHKIKLLDAWREAKGDYGISQALINGFFVVVQGEFSTSYAPKNKWLLQNLSAAIDKAYSIENNLLRKPMKQIEKEATTTRAIRPSPP